MTKFALAPMPMKKKTFFVIFAALLCAYQFGISFVFDRYVNNFPDEPRKIGKAEADFLLALHRLPRFVTFEKESTEVENLSLLLLYADTKGDPDLTERMIMASTAILDKFLQAHRSEMKSEHYFYPLLRKVLIVNRAYFLFKGEKLKSDVDILADLSSSLKLDPFQQAAAYSQIAMFEAIHMKNLEGMKQGFEKVDRIIAESDNQEIKNSAIYFDFYRGIAECALQDSHGAGRVATSFQQLKQLKGFEKARFVNWDWGFSSLINSFRSSDRHVCHDAANVILDK